MRASLQRGFIALAVLAAAVPAFAETLYLQVFINGVDRELIVRVERVAEEMFISPLDAAELGFAADKLPKAAPCGVSLRAIPGVTAEYDAREQTLKLEVPAANLVTQVLTNSGLEQVPPR